MYKSSDNIFINLSIKQRCANLLLTCLDWGCHAKSSGDIEENIRKRLKFQYKFDTVRFRSCIDLIEDTEDAILHFSKYGLQKFDPKSDQELGEIYLKLYGILNAIYLQINCIIEIYEVCRIPNKLKISKQLKNHQIFELRNICGAHTINYSDNSKQLPETFKRDFFRITQCQLNAKGDRLHAVSGFKKYKEFNLYEIVLDYNKLSEQILYEASITYLGSLFPDDQKEKKLREHYALDKFKNFNYREKYENDSIREKYYKRIKRRSKKKLTELSEIKIYDFNSILESWSLPSKFF